MIPEIRRTPIWLHPYLAAALSVASAAAVSWILSDFQLSPGWKLAVAFLGIIPAVALVLAMYLWVRSLDEMQRRIQAEALALAFSASMLAGLILQFLQKAGVGIPFGWELAWQGMGLLYVVAVAFVCRRYA